MHILYLAGIVLVSAWHACKLINKRKSKHGEIDMSKMNIDSVVLAFAGGVVVTSAVLAWKVSMGWLFVTGFVGLNLLQSAFTGFCPLVKILKKFGFKSGKAF